jgi:lysine/arginine/ornithine transport system substrate-binding protein/histidine transport system substrate-binding protein
VGRADGVHIGAGRRTKEIRFGVDPTFAPFEWKDPQGKLAGFDIDLGNAICQQLQAKCVWVESNFDGIIPALKARKFDAILSGMYMTEKRKARLALATSCITARCSSWRVKIR